MKKKAKRKKYAVGTKVNSYIETPNKALAEHNLNLDKSFMEAESNPLLNMMEMLGKASMSAGMQGIAGNMKDGLGKSLLGGASGILPALFAMGGQIPGVPVEIEGEEVGEMPNGKVFEANGPSHEQGGVDVELPEGTEMYSKRIKVDGVSMADRKKKRKKKEVSLEELMAKDKSDVLLKNSLSRTKSNNKKIDEADKKIQETVKSILEPETRAEHKYGLPVKPLDLSGLQKGFDFSVFGLTPEDLGKYNTGNDLINKVNVQEDIVKSAPKTIGDTFVPEATDSNFDLTSILKNINPADVLGYLGTGISTFGPMQNTKNMRAGDTPNINPYENFGADALKSNEEMMQLLGIQKDEANKQISRSSAANARKGRNSARGIAQMRAMDLANNMQDKVASSGVETNYAQQLMQLFGQKAQLENQQDQMQMQGEGVRDANDRADRDAFFSQLSKDISNKGAGLQSFAKSLNKQGTNKETLEMIERMKQSGIDTATIQALIEAIGSLPSTNPKLAKKKK